MAVLGRLADAPKTPLAMIWIESYSPWLHRQFSLKALIQTDRNASISAAANAQSDARYSQNLK
jgi:hypothetical protein